MRSPFPGMDPYLEDRWRDVHQRLVLYASDQLQPQIAPTYRASIEDRIVLNFDDERRGPSFVPDVRIVRDRFDGERAGVGGVAVAEPLVVVLPQTETYHETMIHIVDPKDGDRDVTVIEFLSPTNKPEGEDRDAYLDKQYELKRSDVSLVEIDLLRGGARSLAFPFDLWPHEARSHYAACVTRPAKRRQAEFYGFDLRKPLPAIRIPLRSGDRDAVLDLQKLIDLAYDNGAYDRAVRYAKPPVPPLAADDEAWADALLRAAGTRA